MGLEGLALGLTAISGVTQAIGSVMQGNQQKKAMEYNASVAQEEAAQIRKSADWEIYKQKRAARSLASRQTALFAKAGVLLQGSPLEVMLDSATQAEMDIAITENNARFGEAKAKNQAAYYSYLGDVYQNEGMFKAGTTLLTTTSNMAFMGYSGKKLPQAGRTA